MPWVVLYCTCQATKIKNELELSRAQTLLSPCICSTEQKEYEQSQWVCLRWPTKRHYLWHSCQLIVYAYKLLRCLDVEIWWFLWWWQSETRLITLPLAHVCGVIILLSMFYGNGHQKRKFKIAIKEFCSLSLSLSLSLCAYVHACVFVCVCACVHTFVLVSVCVCVSRGRTWMQSPKYVYPIIKYYHLILSLSAWPYIIIM